METYAAGIRVDREAVEEAMGRIDPGNPESMQELSMEGIFTPEDTPAQRAALARLETVLALVEGWVCHVVDAAAAGRLPNADKLAEMFRRRRAAGGPAEQTFAALVGLELRPRRLREATVLWAALEEHRGISGRDSVWGHPDLLPSGDEIADPDAFARAQLDLGSVEDFLASAAESLTTPTDSDPSAATGEAPDRGPARAIRTTLTAPKTRATATSRAAHPLRPDDLLRHPRTRSAGRGRRRRTRSAGCAEVAALALAG